MSPDRRRTMEVGVIVLFGMSAGIALVLTIDWLVRLAA